MKRFIASLFIIIVLFGSFFVEDQAQSKVEKQNQISGQADSNSYFYTSDYYIFNNAANKETSQSLISTFLPLIHSFFFSEDFAEKRVELAINNAISDYIYMAEYHIIRFEGSAIIHPFNYFW